MSGEETVLVLGNVKSKKQDGNLVMTRSRIAWSRDGSSELTINVPYTNIKSHKISKEGSSKIQLQLVYYDGNTTNFHFAGPDPKSDRKRVSDLLSQSILKSTTAAQASNPELEAKWKLLQDADLYCLYKDMVVSGIITAEEFWANHWNGTTGTEQQSGLPSAFLADLETVSAAGCNTVQYQLSTDIIENIFRTYPTVKEKHSQLVPDQLTEEQFWVQFFQSHKFHRNRLPHSSSQLASLSSGGAAGTSSSGLFHECFENDINAIKSKPVTGSLIKTIDNPLEDTLEESPIKVDKQLVQRCNQHSALVLNAIQSDVSVGPSDRSNMQERALQLTIGPSQIVTDTPPRALLSLASEFLQSSEPQQLLTSSQAQSASVHLLVGGSLMGGASSSLSSIGSSAIESLLRYQRSLGELLRHFWACFPVVNQQLEQKVHRMAQCLQDFKDKQLVEFHSQLSSDSEVKLADQLLVAIDTALSRYQDWISRQK